jgi:hypothetical protein
MQMPPRSEVEALIPQKPGLELLGVAPNEVTMSELEQSVGQELKFFPRRTELPPVWPGTVKIPATVEASGSFTVEADTCSYLLEGEYANLGNNCAPTARLTVTIKF